MARSRLIKPGFFKNEQLAECSPFARLMFAGLWTISDRRGRLEDRPRRIKGELFPYDDVNADELLCELQSNSLLVRYVADGARFLQILTFEKHQNCHVKEPESTIPEPNENQISTVLAPYKNSSGPADTEALNLNPLTEAVNASPKKPWLDPPKSAPKGKRKPTGTTLPDGFGVSEAVKLWAERKGFDSLPDHLEAFIGKALAKPYFYVDWDQAFMNAIREDWAGLRKGRKNGSHKPTLAEKRADNIADITGRKNAGRTIDSDRMDGAAVRENGGDLRESPGDNVGRLSQN